MNIKKIINEKLTFKIQINFWFIVILILLPIIAYADVLLKGGYGFTGYLFVCLIELFLLFIGYSLGYNKRDKEK